MKIMDCLKDKDQWIRFWEYKVSGGHMSKTEQQDSYSFVMNEEYLPVICRMESGEDFPIPEMIVLNKQNSNKKRIVFTCPREENYVLKFMAYLLLRYDSFMSPNLYSFRQNMGAKKAVADLIMHHRKELCAYKVDISDYFNSVDIELLLPQLKKILENEPDVFSFLKEILLNPYVKKDDTLVRMKKGIMAGLPVSAFLANVYLMEMDWYFQEKGILYARYSDDIIIFASTEEELQSHIKTIDFFLRKYRLSVNPSKQVLYASGDKWEYLGFACHQGMIDISEASLQKLKGKLKRKARALYRWKSKNGKQDVYAIRAYIKYFNRKFFDNPVHNEITWCRWYFPIINTAQSLRVIDRYMQQCIRYIATGKYTRANYNLRYETMCSLGYRSLVHEYYSQKNRINTRVIGAENREKYE